MAAGMWASTRAQAKAARKKKQGLPSALPQLSHEQVAVHPRLLHWDTTPGQPLMRCPETRKKYQVTRKAMENYASGADALGFIRHVGSLTLPSLE